MSFKKIIFLFFVLISINAISQKNILFYSEGTNYFSPYIEESLNKIENIKTREKYFENVFVLNRLASNIVFEKNLREIVNYFSNRNLILSPQAKKVYDSIANTIIRYDYLLIVKSNDITNFLELQFEVYSVDSYIKPNDSLNNVFPSARINKPLLSSDILINLQNKDYKQEIDLAVKQLFPETNKEPQINIFIDNNHSVNVKDTVVSALNDSVSVDLNFSTDLETPKSSLKFGYQFNKQSEHDPGCVVKENVGLFILYFYKAGVYDFEFTVFDGISISKEKICFVIFERPFLHMPQKEIVFRSYYSIYDLFFRTRPKIRDSKLYLFTPTVENESALQVLISTDSEKRIDTLKRIDNYQWDNYVSPSRGHVEQNLPFKEIIKNDSLLYRIKKIDTIKAGYVLKTEFIADDSFAGTLFFSVVSRGLESRKHKIIFVNQVLLPIGANMLLSDNKMTFYPAKNFSDTLEVNYTSFLFALRIKLHEEIELAFSPAFSYNKRTSLSGFNLLKPGTYFHLGYTSIGEKFFSGKKMPFMETMMCIFYQKFTLSDPNDKRFFVDNYGLGVNASIGLFSKIPISLVIGAYGALISKIRGTNIFKKGLNNSFYFGLKIF